MNIKTLSERLKLWRSDRPDEWRMDEFIRDAEVLERQLNDLSAKLFEVNEFCQKRGIGKIGDSAVSTLMQRLEDVEESLVELWEFTKCGKVGTVGRCCGRDTRRPV